MEITIKTDNVENESISAFAYTMGKSIETVLNEKTNNLEEENRMLQAKILDFKNKLKQVVTEKDAIELALSLNTNTMLEYIKLNLLIDKIIKMYDEYFEIKKLPEGKIGK